MSCCGQRAENYDTLAGLESRKLLGCQTLWRPEIHRERPSFRRSFLQKNTNLFVDKNGLLGLDNAQRSTKVRTVPKTNNRRFERPKMKRSNLCFLSALILASSSIASHAQLSLDFSANNSTSISFNGIQNTFGFSADANGYQWTVTGQEGGAGMAINLPGNILNGPFSYGPISIAGSVQYATVLGPLGTLVINDSPLGTGAHNLSGTIDWINIATYPIASGALNASLNINVSGLTYAGSNPDLLYLVANQPGSLNVSFQFAVPTTLTQLSTGTGPYSTSYSGSVSVVPEPATLAIAGLGGLALLGLRRSNKIIS